MKKYGTIWGEKEIKLDLLLLAKLLKKRGTEKQKNRFQTIQKADRFVVDSKKVNTFEALIEIFKAEMHRNQGYFQSMQVLYAKLITC